MNTKIIECEYEYAAPKTLEEVLRIIAGERRTKILAGGTDLIVKLKLGVDFQMDIMVDINHINELNRIERLSNGMLSIGTAVKLSNLERADIIAHEYNALYDAIHSMASVSVRNMATLGGNVCNASPVADAVGPLICYGAVLTLKSLTKTREVAIEEFFTAPGMTVIEQDELLVGIRLPKPKPGTGAAFIKMGRVKSDIAKLSVAVVLQRDAEKIESCRIAMGSVAATPLFLKNISASLSGRKFNEDLMTRMAKAVADFIKPIDDNRTTAEYRKKMAELMTKRALLTAWENSFDEKERNI